MRNRTRVSIPIGTAAALVLVLAPGASAAPPERIELNFDLTAAPGPIFCEELGYDITVLQTATSTSTGIRREDGTVVRQVRQSGTVWRADRPETTLTYVGRSTIVQTPDGVRRLSGLLRQYRDEDGRIVYQRAGRNVVDLTGAAEPLHTPNSEPEDAVLCALLAEQ